ncbi:hypothetical protein [Magnetococcus sp. PR-3]|uniref:hypothetical protein n=1 Tax=Magnetococcus sp. PR-3 TaxID=3120355 RepID=UPI002FCE4256
MPDQVKYFGTRRAVYTGRSIDTKPLYVMELTFAKLRSFEEEYQDENERGEQIALSSLVFEEGLQAFKKVKGMREELTPSLMRMVMKAALGASLENLEKN